MALATGYIYLNLKCELKFSWRTFKAIRSAAIVWKSKKKVRSLNYKYLTLKGRNYTLFRQMEYKINSLIGFVSRMYGAIRTVMFYFEYFLSTKFFSLIFLFIHM